MRGSVNTRSIVAAFFAVSAAFPLAARAQDASALPTVAVSAAGARQSESRGFFAEPRVLSKAFDVSRKYVGGDEETGATGKKNGFYPELGNMVTGAGWISAGAGYRHSLFADRALIDVSTGISWRAYKMAQLRFEVTPFADERFAVGTQVRWQDLTQVNYFGEGPESLESNRSQYRLESTDTVGYAIVRPREWLAVHGRLGLLRNPELRQPAGAFLRDFPSTFETFPDDPVYRLDRQPDFLHTEVAVVGDTRDEPGYPTRGGVYRAAWSNYRDRTADMFSFGRYEAEAAHFVPVFDDNVVFAVRGWVVGSSTKPGQHVPFYLAPSLGGSNTLRGYADYRFHDRNLALVNTEMRVAIFEHVDAVALFEAGNVAARFGDLNLEKKSYGFGIRVHSDTATFARLDLARSDEGWRVVFRLNDPFRLSRFNKRTAQVPFAP
jgi:hypothetical protein